MKMAKITAAMFLGFNLTPIAAIAQTYSKTEVAEYHNDKSQWVIGVQKRLSVDGIEVWRTTLDARSQVHQLYQYGKLRQTRTYTQDGSVATVADGNNNVTTLADWYRGTPRLINHPATPESPSGSTQKATVNPSGWITSTTNELEVTTSYSYDSMGRLASTTYPDEPGFLWNVASSSFKQLTASDWMPPGVTSGQWVQILKNGTYRKDTYYDGLWRPVLTHEYDEVNKPGTLRSQSTIFNIGAKVAFQSFTSSELIPAALGTWSFYDATGRIKEVRVDSELGSQLITKTQYESGFKTRVTNPRGYQTVLEYQVFDVPATDALTGITRSAGADTSVTEIHRNNLGLPLRIRKRNADGSLHVDRQYVYDQHHQLCKVIEPETLATVMDYDGAGNLQWSAAGLDLPDVHSCNTILARDSGRKVTRLYDARNRVSSLRFPDGRGDQDWTYYPDGVPATISTKQSSFDTTPVVNTYGYNNRRMLVSETLSQGTGWPQALTYEFNQNGHLSKRTYPDGSSVTYTPNALGQATEVAPYATGIQYHANGAVKRFTYGNGIVHSVVQNVRQLPSRTSDCVSGSCDSAGGRVDLSLTYDAAGNVVAITDNVDGRQTRAMSYDGLDRLTHATSLMFGAASYTYNALDNLTSLNVTAGTLARNYVYAYESGTNRLGGVKDAATGATVVGFGYDVQGNLQNRNGVGHDFDFGNRLREVVNKEVGYAYDGHGRRVRAVSGYMNPRTRGFMYDKEGKLTYATTSGSASSYFYLGDAVIASRSTPSGIPNPQATVTYYHPDVLGTPVATTNSLGSLIETREYEPYGRPISSNLFDRVGYAGHMEDSRTGLIYMEQRYYDPQFALFLSTDPVAAHSNPGVTFHRYRYANSNPFKFNDPDGRFAMPFQTSGRTAEDRLFKELSERLAKDGIEVLRQVKISTVLDDGTRVNAVADYAYRVGDEIRFGEVKFGPEAKLSVNQKAVYAAIEKGGVEVVKASDAQALRVAAGTALKTAGITLHAMEGGRAWRQFAKIGGRAAVKLASYATGTVALGAELMLFTEDVSAASRMDMDCPHCRPAASFEVD